MRINAHLRSGSVTIVFIETAVFTRRVTSLGLEESVRRLQAELAANPVAGDTDPGTGGLRKIRMADPMHRRGKRGGYRVHYLHLAQRGVIYLVFVYGKRELDSLSASQKRALKQVVDAIGNEWKES